MNRRAFSLLELVIVVAIVGLLAVLLAPQYNKFLARSRSTVCLNNLRQVGVAVLSYVGENNGRYPIIEPNENDPLYDPEAGATPLLEALEPYGLSPAVLQCPADKKYFAERGMSYQWRPIIDDENANAPKIYGGRRGASVRVIRPGRVTICTDFTGVHFGRMNRLYADGHVKAQLATP